MMENQETRPIRRAIIMATRAADSTVTLSCAAGLPIANRELEVGYGTLCTESPASKQPNVFHIQDSDAYDEDILLYELENTTSMTSCHETLTPDATGINSHACADDYYQVTDDTCDLIANDIGRSTRAVTRRARAPEAHHGHMTAGAANGELATGGSSHDGVHARRCHDNHERAVDKTARNQLIVVSVLCFLFMIAEIVGGLLSNSLALVTDATHLASDLTSFLVSLFALWLATKPPTKRMTFGYHRAEVLGALISIMIVWIVTGVLIYLGVQRILNPDYTINPNTMLITAGIGVGFNIVMAVVLHSGIFKKCHLPTSLGHNHSHGNHSHSSSHNHHSNHNSEYLPDVGSAGADALEGGHTGVTMDTDVVHFQDDTTYHSNINIRAAVLHVIGDLIQSIGVLIAAVIIKIKPEYKLADPICTFLFSILVFVTTITVLRDVGSIIMEAVPRDFNVGAMKKDLADIECVKSVHHIHAWALTINTVAVSVHLAVRGDAVTYRDVLHKAGSILRDRHHVTYQTIQIEEYDDVMSMCVTCNK